MWLKIKRLLKDDLYRPMIMFAFLIVFNLIIILTITVLHSYHLINLKTLFITIFTSLGISILYPILDFSVCSIIDKIESKSYRDKNNQ
ncbi:hypothetical protein [Mycoplasma mycoides]|uniref:hypothetical protein n=1 Tax=Mycoplasma mycoides TaxID=2102 RepID=UPI00223FAAB7|nr:hypothetical protein [Mycoplasma mycoides]QVJ96035.1 hypothetical protein I7632_03315 [Mycoplasma mycoides subsp. capri]QVJ96930.1 hypothetical protein I7633_03270 [Mycoplasma mycoides subsp. capri]QVK00793.1 hypothetical protein I7635_03265 [Mycoplasma mycoides subsp. capri]